MALASDGDSSMGGFAGAAGHPSGLPVLRGLTPAQRAAVTAPAGPVCVVAGAGSGKTRVLTRRVAFRALTGDASPEHVMVVTFTRKAAGELRRRLWQLGVDGVATGTFHGLAYGELRRHWADTGRPAPAVLADPVPMVRRLLGATPTGGAGRDARSRRDGDLVRAVAAEVDWARSRALEPAAYPQAARQAGRRPPLAVDDVGELLERYAQEKRRRRVVDLHDLVAQATALLEHDRAVAEAVRWRIRHLLVDEFQDVNPAQWRLVRALLGGRSDLFVVGDPNQAIYAWNGADPTLMTRLPELVPGTTLFALDDNHRCTPQVVAAAAAVLATDRTGGGARPGSTRSDGPLPEVRDFGDDADEAAAVVRWLRSVRPPGGRWANLAVLARTHARLGPVAEALARAGIPYHYGQGAGRPVPADRSPSDDAAEDELSSDPDPPEATPPMPAGRPSAVGADGRPADDTPGDGSSGERIAGSSGESGDGASGESGDGAWADGVELATFHRAKGLEWEAVALVGLEAGTVPIIHARSPDAVAEERRLLYVALTRAGRHLWCSWAGQRVGAPRPQPAAPSPWLADVRAACVAPPQSAPPVARRHLQLLRAQLADVTADDPAPGSA